MREIRIADTANGDLKDRSEEHTSELQSRSDFVCRLLLEKKKTIIAAYRFIEHIMRSRGPADGPPATAPRCGGNHLRARGVRVAGPSHRPQGPGLVGDYTG